MQRRVLLLLLRKVVPVGNLASGRADGEEREEDASPVLEVERVQDTGLGFVAGQLPGRLAC